MGMPGIVVLTGAGISAESGLQTFRATDGLWYSHRIEDVATPEGFARDPALVHEFYDRRRADALAAVPNAAHVALARLEREVDPGLVVVTQNVDDLHERAGSSRVIHLHGELNSALCGTCGTRTAWTAPLGDRPPCPSCGARTLRPDIVWFGEAVYHLDEIEAATLACETFVVIGTSGVVYPAAGLAALARTHGARTVLLNLEDQDGGFGYDEVRLGPASEVVPAWVDEQRGAGGG
jgi:NAD-dependent deacetylase